MSYAQGRSTLGVRLGVPVITTVQLGPRTLFFFPFPLFYSLIPKMIPYYSCNNSFLCINTAFPAHVETVGERRRSKRDEHDERSDSLDVAVAEVDEATLPSLPLPLPLASTSIDYCRVIGSTKKMFPSYL